MMANKRVCGLHFPPSQWLEDSSWQNTVGGMGGGAQIDVNKHHYLPDLFYLLL